MEAQIVFQYVPWQKNHFNEMAAVSLLQKVKPPTGPTAEVKDMPPPSTWLWFGFSAIPAVGLTNVAAIAAWKVMKHTTYKLQHFPIVTRVSLFQVPVGFFWICGNWG